MSHFGLMHKVASYKIGNKESLIEALTSLSDGDCDFNGENGLEYLKKEVWEANGFKNEEDYNNSEKPELTYESNQDYYLSLVSKEDNEQEAIIDFLSNWLDHDRYYYEWNYELDEQNGIGFISIASLTYC